MTILNLEEAAAFLKISKRSLRDKMRREPIPCTKLGAKWLFSDKQLTEYVEKKTKALFNPVQGVTSICSSPPKPMGRRRNKPYGYFNRNSE